MSIESTSVPVAVTYIVVAFEGLSSVGVWSNQSDSLDVCLGVGKHAVVVLKQHNALAGSIESELTCIWSVDVLRTVLGVWNLRGRIKHAQAELRQQREA
jgi:hypothetical protein